MKLPSYKYSDDIFKKLTIIPDAKNHMMMLLDCPGSMPDCLFDTVKQLINLVEFCRKVNIPYELYFLLVKENNMMMVINRINQTVKQSGEFNFEDFNLVNCK